MGSASSAAAAAGGVSDGQGNNSIEAVLELLDDPRVTHFLEQQREAPRNGADLASVSEARRIVATFRGILGGEFVDMRSGGGGGGGVASPASPVLASPSAVQKPAAQLGSPTPADDAKTADMFDDDGDDELFAHLSDSDDEDTVASPGGGGGGGGGGNGRRSGAASPASPTAGSGSATPNSRPFFSSSGGGPQGTPMSATAGGAARPIFRRQASAEYFDEINKSSKKIKALRRKLHVLSSRLETDGDAYDEDGQKVMGGLEDLFKRFDTAGNGMLTMAQLRLVLKKMKVRLSGEEMEVLQASFDVDGDGLVNYHEFKSFTMQSEGEELGSLWSRMRRNLDKYRQSEGASSAIFADDDDDDDDDARLFATDSGEEDSGGVLSPNSKRNVDRSSELGRLLARQGTFEELGNGRKRVTVAGLKNVLETIKMTLDNKTLETVVKNFGVKRDGKEVSFLDVLRCAANDFEDHDDEDEMLYIDVDKLCHWLCPAVADIVRLKQRIRQFLKSASDDLRARSKGQKELSEYDAAVSIFDSLGDFADADDKHDAMAEAGGAGHLTAEQFRRAVSAMGMPISDQEARALVLEFDDDHNGTIEADEFATHLLTITASPGGKR